MREALVLRADVPSSGHSVRSASHAKFHEALLAPCGRNRHHDQPWRGVSQRRLEHARLQLAHLEQEEAARLVDRRDA
jgi:hypothetical protein